MSEYCFYFIDKVFWLMNFKPHFFFIVRRSDANVKRAEKREQVEKNRYSELLTFNNLSTAKICMFISLHQCIAFEW